MTDESPVIKRNKKKPRPIAEDPFVSDDDDDFQGIVLQVTGLVKIEVEIEFKK